LVDTEGWDKRSQEGVHVSGTPGKPQPTYTPQCRADAVRLVQESGKSMRQVAADRGLAVESLRRWVLQAKIAAGTGPAGALTSAEREELRRLRREVATLRMEREILKQATAFFAKETS
jgi:transposase